MQGTTRRGVTVLAGFSPARTALALLALAGLSVLGQVAAADTLDRSPLPRANPAITVAAQELAAVKPRTRPAAAVEVVGAESVASETAAPVAVVPEVAVVAAPPAGLVLSPSGTIETGVVRTGAGFGLTGGIEAIPVPAGAAPSVQNAEAPLIGALTGLPVAPEAAVPVAADRITKSSSNSAPPSLRHAFAAGVPLASLPVARIRPAVSAPSVGPDLGANADAAPASVTVQIAGPDTPRPQTRPDTATIAAAPDAAMDAPRPRARPAGVEKAAEEKAAVAAAAPAPAAPLPEDAPAARIIAALPEATSLRPRQRPAGLSTAMPEKITRTAAARAPVIEQPKTPAEKRAEKNRAKEAVSAKGSVCGVAAIKGVRIDPITSKNSGCGLTDGVKVTSISGVKLSQAITVDCTTAKALNSWVEKVVQPTYGGKLVELKIAGSYSCRPRNNQRGAKVSEHGRGKAVDISGVVLSNGKSASVLKGYDKTMRAAYRGACGIFGTTLGPGSDGFHEDHMHFDTASHRNGSYCR